MEAWLPDYCYNPHRRHTTEALVVHFISLINLQPDDPFDFQSNWWFLHDMNCERDRRVLYPNCNDWLPDPNKRTYASYHCVIARDGTEYLLVPEDKYAYHAGTSHWKGRANLNTWANGTALLGHTTSGFTDAQYATLARRGARLIREYNFPLDNVVGHEEVSPGRKVDPGIKTGNFDMTRLKRLISENG